MVIIKRRPFSYQKHSAKWCPHSNLDVIFSFTQLSICTVVISVNYTQRRIKRKIERIISNGTPTTNKNGYDIDDDVVLTEHRLLFSRSAYRHADRLALLHRNLSCDSPHTEVTKYVKVSQSPRARQTPVSPTQHKTLNQH